MAKNRIEIELKIKAPRSKVWSAIADWESQGDWMLQTKVIRSSSHSEGVGVEIEAFTGPFYRLFPKRRILGLHDLMRVTKWEPPHTCEVLHYGKVLKGMGLFSLRELDASTTLFHWEEEILAPKLIFLVLKPFFILGVKISLSRFAQSLE